MKGCALYGLFVYMSVWCECAYVRASVRACTKAFVNCVQSPRPQLMKTYVCG